LQIIDLALSKGSSSSSSSSHKNEGSSNSVGKDLKALRSEICELHAGSSASETGNDSGRGSTRDFEAMLTVHASDRDNDVSFKTAAADTREAAVAGQHMFTSHISDVSPRYDLGAMD
jgi:hypothetical protein